MAIRIPWDEHEAAYLLFELIRVLNNEISRNEAIQRVSDTLRKRALKKGITIDDIFRNINGITLQMSVMEYMYTEGRHGLKKSSMPKLFQQVIDLYKTEKNSFEKLVREIIVMSYEKSIEEQFYSWLSKQISPNKLSDLHTAFTNISSFCLERKILKRPLLETVDIAVLNNVRTTVDSNKVFRFTYKRQLSKMSAGMRQYITFIKEHPEFTEIKEMEEKNTVEKIFDKACQMKTEVTDDRLINLLRDRRLNYIDLRNKNGCLWIIGGANLSSFAEECGRYGVVLHYKEDGGNATAGEPAWWTKDSIKETSETINATVSSGVNDTKQPLDSNTLPVNVENSSDNKKAFICWMQENGSANATIMSYLSAIGQCTRNALQLKITETDLYDVENSAELLQIRDRLLSVSSFKELNDQQHNRFLSAMNKLIAYRQTMGENLVISPKSNVTVSQSDDIYSRVPSELIEKYEHILFSYFGEDGYQPGRAIFRGRFKRFYSSEYGTDPSETDEGIDGILQLVGTMRDGRIFPKQDSDQNDLIKEIIEDIISAFEEGATGIYIEAVFNKYQLQLAENLQIYNMDALIPMLLSGSNGKFTQKYSYFVKQQGNADPASDILRIMQGFHEPQNYEAIHEKAWYIPYDKMKTLLVWDKSIVNVAPEAYFYAPNLPISSAEIQQLISVIRTELEYRSHITDVELMDLINSKCLSVAINTDGFTTYGLRNCLGYILREQFSFNGPIISHLGRELSMSDVYAEFARTHEELNFEDLKRLSVEMNIGIYWDSVLEEMVRVSDQKMIRRDLIDFDVESIDNVLDGMCPGQYVSIKDISLFLQFPNIGYAWNHYVLESYLFKNSRKFRLLHVSFGQNGVCGAMVRADSTITDYRTLIVDALSKSDALGSTKAALQYIVDRGYQQRRRYDGVEQLIQEAKLIKEQRENEGK